MGSGSSKAKAQPQKETTKSSGGTKTKPDIIIPTDTHDQKTTTSNITNGNKANNINQKSYGTKAPTSGDKKNTEQHSKVNENGGKNNNVTKSNSTKNLGKFESDSDSEEEDIGVVLAATRTAQQNRLNEEKRIQELRDSEQYPETYAQRLQREQYRQQQQSLFRQKTIYRNPDEWDVDENTVEGFDARKFKEVNAPKAQSNDRDSFDNEPNTDFYGNQGDSTQLYTSQSVDYHRPQQETADQARNIPSYDTSEEALLAEIEQQFA